MELLKDSDKQSQTEPTRKEKVKAAESVNLSRFRLFPAYSTTIRILISLGFFHLKGKLMGAEWTARHLEARYVKNARRLKNAILQLKGLFIKVGQLISIMSNFLPEAFRAELEELQDKIPARPYSEISTRIQNEFGKTPDTLFATFEQQPIASASLAQVHKAALQDGRTVAVKVQHLDIEKIAKEDLRAIRRLITLVSFILRFRGLDTNFDQIRDMIMEELNFEMEGRYINAISANFEGDPQVSFPEVIAEFSSERVLTTTFIDGFKISNLDAIATHNIDRQELAERVLMAYCQMIFSDGIYHADPHPGNILVRPDGSIVFIDFGAVAQLSSVMKESIPQFLEGILRRDPEQVINMLKRMGFVAHNENDYQAERIIEYVYSRFLEDLSFDSWNLQDIAANVDLKTKMEVMGDIRKMNISFRELTSTFQMPKDWILLERTILLLMGLCTHLSPTMNPMKTIRPYLEEFVLGKDRDWMKLVTTVVKDMAMSVLTVPEQMNSVLGKADRGELEMKVHGLRESANLLYALGHQVIYGMFAMVAGGMSYVAYSNGEMMLADGLALGSGFFLLCFGGSLLLARKWRR